jgi:Protein of unknown function (DUF2946)
MGWFRSRSRWGSYLALFALAFQLVISFGHVHLDGCTSTAGHASIVAKAAVDPVGKQSPAVADDHCPFCALIHLAGTLTPSEAPTLSRLASFRRLLLLAAIEFDFAAALHHSSLGARAPPLA